MAKKMNLKFIDGTALTLLVVGGINWGLDYLGLNLVESISNATIPMIGTALYTLVAASGVWIGIRALMGKIKLVN